MHLGFDLTSISRIISVEIFGLNDFIMVYVAGLMTDIFRNDRYADRMLRQKSSDGIRK